MRLWLCHVYVNRALSFVTGLSCLMCVATFLMCFSCVFVISAVTLKHLCSFFRALICVYVFMFVVLHVLALRLQCLLRCVLMSGLCLVESGSVAQHGEGNVVFVMSFGCCCLVCDIVCCA